MQYLKYLVTDLISEEHIEGEEEDGHAHHHPSHRLSQTLQESRRAPSVNARVLIPTILTGKLQHGQNQSEQNIS